MIGRKTAAGLSLLGALFICAFVAQSAMAEPANNTTAVTCVKVEPKKGDFADAHCDEKKVEGDFAHEKIANNVTTEITVTNDKTVNKTTEASSHLLKGVLAGVNAEITCKTVHGEGTLHNVEPVEKQHKVTGTITIKYTNCEAKKPAKCKVVEPIEFKALFEGVEKTGPEKNTMGVLFKPEEGTVFVKITLEGAECALKGKPLSVEGTAVATGTPSPTAKHSGATSVFTAEMTRETLSIGGNKAEYSGTTTTIMKPTGENPIALTTTT